MCFRRKDEIPVVTNSFIVTEKKVNVWIENISVTAVSTAKIAPSKRESLLLPKSYTMK